MMTLQEQKSHLKQMLAGAEGLVRGILVYFPPVQIDARRKEPEQTVAIFREYERLTSNVIETVLRHAPTSADKVIVVAGVASSRGEKNAFLAPVFLKWQETQIANFWFPARFLCVVPTIPAPIRSLKYQHKILPPQSNLLHTAVAYHRWKSTKTPYAPRVETTFSLTDMEQMQWGALLYGYAPNQKPEGFLRFLAHWACNGGAKMLLVGSHLRVEKHIPDPAGKVYFAPVLPYKLFADMRMHPLAKAWIDEEEHDNNENPDEPETP